MVWGAAARTPRAELPPIRASKRTQRHQFIAIENTADAKPPAIAVCTGCEASAVLPMVDGEAKLPDGWVTRPDPFSPTGNAAYCAECSPRVTKLQPSPRPAPPEGDLRVIPEDAPPGGYLGCRIRYWKVHAGVVLRIHAGAAPRAETRDDPLHFLMQPTGLRKLIEDLTDILAEVEAEAQS